MPSKMVIAFGPFKDFIADGVRAGDTIHLSGVVSIDAQGKTVHAGDIVKQGQQAYRNLREVLEKFGTTMDSIVDETLFVTDMGAIFGTRAEAYGGNPQLTQSLIGVKEFVMPDLLIEINVVAHV